MKLDKIKISNSQFLTDGGLETTLIFHEGIDLPHFAAFPLIEKPKYKKVLIEYYKKYLHLAAKYHTGFILESATWRANRNWGFKLGYTEKELIEINKLAIQQLKELKNEYVNKVNPILISGNIGPSRDGYKVTGTMSVEDSKKYHNQQIAAFKDAGVDLVTAITVNYINEGLGIVKSAEENELPVVISFTVETDGKLPSGEHISEAIQRIDKDSGGYPLYYMINCAHPSHFAKQLNSDSTWKHRIKGIRANASCKSHAELDESLELDAGNKQELAQWYSVLKTYLPGLIVYGGCCGTDASHIEAICKVIYEKEGSF